MPAFWGLMLAAIAAILLIVLSKFAHDTAGDKEPPPAGGIYSPPLSQEFWKNSDNAPPAFEDVKPHPYDAYDLLPCCKQCGGGRLHAIHTAADGSYTAARPVSPPAAQP
jgi:hypothetical protein